MAKETLRIELKVDGAAQATAATKQVQGGILSLSGTVDRASATLSQMRTILTGLAVGGLGALVRSTVNAADELSKLSTRLGISVESLSQLQFAADRSGVSFDAMSTALQRQTRRVAEAAKGTGEAVKAFQELGLSAEKIKSLAPDQQFEVLADALSGVADSGDRVRLAMKFWDSEGVKLLQVAEGGADAVRALRDESDALGRTLSAETAEAAAKLNDQVRNLRGAMEAITNTVANALIPWLSETVTAFQNAGTRIARATEQLFGFRAELSQMGIREVTTEMDQLSQEMARIYQWLDRNRKQTKGWTDEMRKAVEQPKLDKLAELSEEYKKAAQRQKELTGVYEVARVKLKDYEGETLSATAATKAVTTSTKDQADALQALLDKLLPAEKATRDFEKSLALLDEAFFSGAISAERYDAAIESLMTGVPEAAKAGAARASKEIRTEFDRTGDWMAQSLTDAIMRGFEGGAGFVENFIQTMKNWFGTLVLRPIIQPIAASAVGALGFGTSGSAAAGGLGGMGGISNIGGLMGGGSSISGLLNSAAVGLGYNPAGAAGPTALFGGTGLGYGLAGLGGGLIGTYLGNGSTASSIGGSLGGMLGYGVAAGSAFGGTALGMQLGSFAGPIGMIAGAVIGTVIGSLLSGSKGDKSPDLQVTPTGLALRPDEIRTTGSGGTNIQSLFVPSPFGGLSYTTKHDAFGSMEDAQAFAAALTGVGAIETALADMVGTEKTEQIAAALGDVLGDAMIKLAEDPGEWESGLEALLATRFDTAFEIIGGQMERVYLSIGDGAAEAAAATVDLFGALRALSDVQQTYSDLVEAQNRTLFQTQREHAAALSELIAGYRGGLAATQDLTAALGEQATLQVQLLSQIDSIRASTDTVLGGLIEKLTLDLMGSDAERYDYLRSQAEGLAASLTGITDPVEIDRIIKEIAGLTQQGLGLLTPEQLQGGMGADFLDFLTGVRDVSDAQLELARQQTLAQGELIQQQADAAIAQLEAAERLSAAADAITGAAVKLGSQPIVVQIGDSGSEALRPI